VPYLVFVANSSQAKLKLLKPDTGPNDVNDAAVLYTVVVDLLVLNTVVVAYVVVVLNVVVLDVLYVVVLLVL
jgi:hypothetical protein